FSVSFVSWKANDQITIHSGVGGSPYAPETLAPAPMTFDSFMSEIENFETTDIPKQRSTDAAAQTTVFFTTKTGGHIHFGVDRSKRFLRIFDKVMNELTRQYDSAESSKKNIGTIYHDLKKHQLDEQP
ncbi:MAG: hypothetical protein AAF492_18035, partial [Verrucomicrobiota bacterium]